MSGLQYYVIDTETTGLKAGYQEITEISIIRTTDRVQFTEMVKCEFPERANIDSLTITKKTIADLSNGLSRQEVVEKMDGFLQRDGLTPAHRCFVAHNYSFDKRFIHALYSSVDKNCPVNLWLCTMAMIKSYIKKNGLGKVKSDLSTACSLLGIKKFATQHASKMDSRNTYLLWKSLVEEHQIDYLPHIKTIPHILSPGEDEHLDPDLLDLD